MELIRKSAINETWKLCTIAGFLGLFLLTLLITNNTPQTFQISTSRTTAVEVSSLEEEKNSTSSGAGVPEHEIPAGQANFTKNSDEVLLQSFNSPTLEEKTFPSVSSPPEAESCDSSSANATAGAAEYETKISEKVLFQSFNPPTIEEKTFPSPSSPPEAESGDSSATNATAGAAEYEIPAGQANFTHITNTSDTVLFQSFNSSAFEEKLFSSLPEADPTSVANATSAGGGEYEIPNGDTKYDNSTSMKAEEEKMLMMSPEAMSTATEGSAGENCRMYEGRWVYKPEENPRYHVSQCNFLEDKMSCRRNGRPDFEYERWSWESDGCHVPLFNGTDMMERLRGKRMIMAGDSLNRNQWESLACLLYTSIPPRRAHVDASDPAYKVFKAKDYEFTLEFYWAPFLVHLDENHKSGKKVLSLDKLVPSSEQWRGADVMVFNSGHWWTHHGKFKAWDVFECDGEQVEEVQTEIAYERALTVWAQWVAHNVDQTKTKVYFRSISPEHKGKQWCFNHSRPMEDDESYKQIYPRTLIDAVERKIREINGQDGVLGGVRYLNITGLSSHRIDAHPSIYRFKHWKVIMDKYKRLLKSRSDCSHWCLPGLPDTWNRILYASLFFDHLIAGDLSIS